MERLPSRREASPETLSTRYERANTTLTNELSTQEGQVTPALQERIARIGEKTRKVLGATTQATMILTLALTLNQARTRYDQYERSSGASGEVVYEHEDPQTTALLEYMTGKSKLPAEQHIYFERQYVRELLGVMLSEETDKKIDTMTTDELRELLVENSYVLSSRLDPSDPASHRLFEEKAKSTLADAAPKYEYNSKVHDAIWKLQKQVGSPKVRWAAEGVSLAAHLTGESAGKGRAFFDPLTNTVYLPPNYPAEALVGEDAHAKQFNEHPIRSYGKLASGWGSAVVRSVRHFEDIRASYQHEYTKPGSLEWEAHKRMEPSLKEQALKELQEKGQEDVPPIASVS